MPAAIKIRLKNPYCRRFIRYSHSSYLAFWWFSDKLYTHVCLRVALGRMSDHSWFVLLRRKPISYPLHNSKPWLALWNSRVEWDRKNTRLSCGSAEARNISGRKFVNSETQCDDTLCHIQPRLHTSAHSWFFSLSAYSTVRWTREIPWKLGVSRGEWGVTGRQLRILIG